MLQLEKSFFSIGIDVVGNRRSTERDRFAQHFLHRPVQLVQLLARDGGRAAAGT
jgi:hypothetical protein